MTKTQRTFTKELKLEAVQLAKNSQKPLTHIANDLGIADSTLHHWCKQFGEQGEQGFVGSGHQLPQEEELRQLKRENELLRQERDVLKKLSASSHATSVEVCVHRRAQRSVLDCVAVPGTGRVAKRVLRLETA